MRMVAESKEELLKQDYKCAQKAKERGDITFTVVEQDKSSPKVIAFWIMENIETAPDEKLLAALATALVMRKSENRKAAD